eukprot:m.127973 g.127973  ORF g.127973 m.127973 type:complete len:170 (-) comp13861_c0_seq2:1166-1675(-)
MRAVSLQTVSATFADEPPQILCNQVKYLGQRVVENTTQEAIEAAAANIVTEFEKCRKVRGERWSMVLSSSTLEIQPNTAKEKKHYSLEPLMLHLVDVCGTLTYKQHRLLLILTKNVYGNARDVQCHVIRVKKPEKLESMLNSISTQCKRVFQHVRETVVSATMQVSSEA